MNTFTQNTTNYNYRTQKSNVLVIMQAKWNNSNINESNKMAQCCSGAFNSFTLPKPAKLKRDKKWWWFAAGSAIRQLCTDWLKGTMTAAVTDINNDWQTVVVCHLCAVLLLHFHKLCKRLSMFCKLFASRWMFLIHPVSRRLQLLGTCT